MSDKTYIAGFTIRWGGFDESTADLRAVVSAPDAKAATRKILVALGDIAGRIVTDIEVFEPAEYDAPNPEETYQL